MKHRKKISGFFISIAILPLLSLVILQFYQQYVRHEMEEKLEKESALTIVIPETDLKWIEYGKEIIYKQQMFDIKSIKIENGLAIVTGLFDKKEKEIFKLINDSTEESDTWSGIIHILQTLFYVVVDFESNVLALPSLDHPLENTMITSRSLPAPAQPPWV